MKEGAIRSFLSRYFDYARKQADKMKTDKGKAGKYKKFYQNLQSYYELMDNENIEYAQTRYQSEIDKLNKTKDAPNTTNSFEYESETSSTAIVESKQESPATKLSSMSFDWNISISFGRSSSQNFDRAFFS